MSSQEKVHYALNSVKEVDSENVVIVIGDIIASGKLMTVSQLAHETARFQSAGIAESVKLRRFVQANSFLLVRSEFKVGALVTQGCSEQR